MLPSLVLFFLISASQMDGFKTLTAEHRLVRDIRRFYAEYARNGRPVLNASDPVSVGMAFHLHHIQKIDIENQMMTVVGWHEYSWFDPNLTWNPKDYDGVENVQLEPQWAWVPDVQLLNAALPDIKLHHVKMTASSDGNANWTPSYVHRSLCLTLPRYPIQRCTLHFGTLVDNALETNLFLSYPNVGTSALLPSNTWTLIHTSAMRDQYEIRYEPNKLIPHTELEFNITVLSNTSAQFVPRTLQSISGATSISFSTWALRVTLFCLVIVHINFATEK